MKVILALLVLVSACTAYGNQEDLRVVDVVDFSRMSAVDDGYRHFQIVNAFYRGNKTIREARWSEYDNDDNVEFKREPVESAAVVEITVANKNPYAPKYIRYGGSDLDNEIPNYHELTFYVKAEAFSEKDVKGLKHLTKRSWRPSARKQRIHIVKNYFGINETQGQRKETVFEVQCATCKTTAFDSGYNPIEDYCADRNLKKIPVGKEIVKYRTVALAAKGSKLYTAE